MKLEISFGALSPKLADQIKAAGIQCSLDEIEIYQKDSDAINRLAIRGLMRDSEKSRMNKALFKKIVKFLETR